MSRIAPSTRSGDHDWEDTIRGLEEQARLAFLAADVSTLDRLWADSYVVNSPVEQVHDKARILGLLQAGVIRHETYDCDIEHISRHGDVVVVMGRDHVTGPPAGDLRRRYTNVWQLQDGQWRSIARHAQRGTQPETDD